MDIKLILTLAILLAASPFLAVLALAAWDYGRLAVDELRYLWP